MPFLDLRLHKKSLVVDGESAFVGGLNIGAENLIAKRPKAPVRDTHFRVEGTIVRQIEQEFDDDWSFTTGEEAMGTGSVRQEPASRGSAARTIVAGPDQEVDQLVLVLLSAINFGAAFDQDRHAVLPARRATHYGAPIGRLARCGRASRFALA